MRGRRLGFIACCSPRPSNWGSFMTGEDIKDDLEDGSSEEVIDIPLTIATLTMI